MEEEQPEFEDDFDLGHFFNNAERYGDDPYMALAITLFEKAPRNCTPLRSQTMMNSLSKRYQQDNKNKETTFDELDPRDAITGKQVIFTLPQMSAEGELVFDKVSYRLPTSRDKAGFAARVALLKFLDSGNTGRMSIEDLKFGFARIISMPGMNADVEEMLEDVITLAQKAVQELMLDGAPRKDDDVLTKEFRVFLTYLQGYVDMWEIFRETAQEDDNGEAYLDLEEFIDAAPRLREWGLRDPALIKNTKQVFDQIDVDESGTITFGEFADYCVVQGLMEDVAKDLRNA